MKKDAARTGNLTWLVIGKEFLGTVERYRTEMQLNRESGNEYSGMKSISV